MIDNRLPGAGWRLGRVAAVCAVGLLALHCKPPPTPQPAARCDDPTDLLLVNGEILTLDPAQDRASWIAIRGDAVWQVGRDESWRDRLPPCVKPIDLAGRTVIPGLIDSHLHFVRHGLLPGHDVRDAEVATTIAELLTTLAEASTALTDDRALTVIGGIYPTQFAEDRLPTLAELDATVSGRVVFLQVGFAGPAVTNSAGRALLAQHAVEVGEDGILARGEQTNRAFAVLQGLETPESGRARTIGLMAHANRLGLTTVFDEGGTTFPGASFFDTQHGYDTLMDLWRERAVTVRVRLQFGGSAAHEEGMWWDAATWRQLGDDYVRAVALGEHVVGFPVDGVVDPGYQERIRGIARTSWPHEQHSTSHAENQQHLAAIEAIHQESPITDLRWTLSHVFELGLGVSAANLARLTALGMGVRVQNQGYTIPTDRFPLGRSLGGAEWGPRYRELIDAELPVAAGTDGALGMPMNPWLSIYYMVTGKNNRGQVVNASQKVTRLEALAAYTRGSAWLSFEEERLGSLAPGRLADLAVLDRPYLRVPEAELRRTRSVLTVVGGKVVHAGAEVQELLDRAEPSP